MGGLAGGRYIGNRANRGKTTGDVIGGGGRSVMPRRIDAERRNAMARFNSAQNELQRQYEQFQAATQQPRGPLVPPGGGYSGGVIPRFQTGGAPRRTGALHGSIIGDPSSGRWVEHFPAIGQNPIYSGWGAVDTTQRGLTKRSFNNQNLPYPNRPPGGGYSGGVIPRFQAGGVPVGGGYGEYVKGFLGKTSGPGMREWARDRANKASHIQQAQRNLAPPRPRGWQLGGAVGYSHGGVFPRHGSVTEDPTNPGSYSIWKRGRTIGDLMGGGGRSIMPTRRRGNYNFNRSELYPNWSATGTGTPAPMVPTPPGGGYSGGVVPSFQTGGQLEDPLYPVESELADESPWYPDEEVGFEEAAPMQGGFDIFGRSGG
jgi:hypothetical protein